jgi:DNA polymerase epsilon subunit 3
VWFLRVKDGPRANEGIFQDLSLPKSIITRLAKGVLPANTQIQANAVLALSKSTTVFISHLAAAYVRPLPHPGASY